MYESSWLWIAPAASENNGLMKTAVNRTAKPRKAATRVCSACLAFRQESDGLTLSFPGRVSSVSSVGGLSMSNRGAERRRLRGFLCVLHFPNLAERDILRLSRRVHGACQFTEDRRKK